jgi:hypothetical protein
MASSLNNDLNIQMARLFHIAKTAQKGKSENELGLQITTTSAAQEQDSTFSENVNIDPQMTINSSISTMFDANAAN